MLAGASLRPVLGGAPPDGLGRSCALVHLLACLSAHEIIAKSGATALCRARNDQPCIRRSRRATRAGRPPEYSARILTASRTFRAGCDPVMRTSRCASSRHQAGKPLEEESPHRLGTRRLDGAVRELARSPLAENLRHRDPLPPGGEHCVGEVPHLEAVRERWAKAAGLLPRFGAHRARVGSLILEPLVRKGRAGKRFQSRPPTTARGAPRRRPDPTSSQWWSTLSQRSRQLGDRRSRESRKIHPTVGRPRP